MKTSSKQRITEIFEAAPSSVKAYEIEKHLRHFCNNTSEELSTILGTLAGELDYALTSQSAELQTGAIKSGMKTLDRLMLLARNLRYFAVHTRLDTHVTDFSQTILTTLDLFDKEFRDRNIQIAAFVESGLYLRVDPLAMGQVFFNLLKNASDSMKEGGKLTLSLTKNHEMLEVCISDTGSGISKKDMEHLFEPYANQELGLTVAKALIEAHGGDIIVRSSLGKGTNFILHLPYDPEIPKGESYMEKRRFRRIPIRLAAEFNEDHKSSVKTVLTTLSVGGCFLTTGSVQDVPTVQSHVSIKIYFQDDSFIEIPKARVVSVNPNGPECGLGIEFVETGSKAKKVLQAIVKSHST